MRISDWSSDVCSSDLMTGATQMRRAQSEVAHNLANADTVGFKAQLSAFQPLAVQGPGMPTRVNGVAQGLGVDMREGGQIETGRELDVAVQGQGWIAVQGADGSESYTRAGELRLTPDGLLTDSRGNLGLGARSEERRVGKEGVSTCRSRGEPV